MRGMESDSVDLVCCSPPYEAARTYGIDFKLRGQEWVDWMVERIREMCRVCKGLVAVVCEGQTRGYKYSAAPILLMADLHRAGFNLRKPPVFHRIGIPGSGGPDWLRNDYEFIVCVTPAGKLPWSDNTAMGAPCKYGPGGVPSNRLTNGERANLATMRKMVVDGIGQREAARLSGVRFKTTTSGIGESGTLTVPTYIPPELANPGNVIHCKIGGGKMGSCLAHENEAPYPERLAEFFIRSFCPPGGIVLDPFSGSGTTASVAQKCGREFIAIDVRESQVDLTQRRLVEKPKAPKPAKRPKPMPSQSTLF